MMDHLQGAWHVRCCTQVGRVDMLAAKWTKVGWMHEDGQLRIQRLIEFDVQHRHCASVARQGGQKVECPDLVVGQ